MINGNKLVLIIDDSVSKILSALLKQAGLTSSTSESFRMIQQGAVKLDGEKIADRGLQLARGTVVVAQVGKRKFARISLV